jgi:hypothetical protein
MSHLGGAAPVLMRQIELKAAMRPPPVADPRKSPWRPPGQHCCASVVTRFSKRPQRIHWQLTAAVAALLPMLGGRRTFMPQT